MKWKQPVAILICMLTCQSIVSANVGAAEVEPFLISGANGAKLSVTKSETSMVYTFAKNWEPELDSKADYLNITAELPLSGENSASLNPSVLADVA